MEYWHAPSNLPEAFNWEIPFNSLYLFILCDDGFLAVLQEDHELGALPGFRIGNGPFISHFFADDSLLFSRADAAQATKLRDIFSLYKSFSGQTNKFWEV